MNSAILSTGTLLVGMAIGYIADFGGVTAKAPVKENPPMQQAGQPSIPAADAVLSDFLEGRSPSQITADEARILLAPMFKRHIYDTTRETTREGVQQEYQMRLLLAELPLPTLEQTLDLARDGTIPFFRTHEAFAAYAIRDWDRAMAWAEKQRDKRDLNAAALSWLAETEPDKATALYQQALLNDVVQYDGVTLSKLARHHARKGPDAFLDFLETLPSLEDDGKVLRAVNDMPISELPAFQETFSKRVMELQFGNLGDLMENVFSRDPERIKELTAAMKEADKKKRETGASPENPAE